MIEMNRSNRCKRKTFKHLISILSQTGQIIQTDEGLTRENSSVLQFPKESHASGEIFFKTHSFMKTLFLVPGESRKTT